MSWFSSGTGGSKSAKSKSGHSSSTRSSKSGQKSSSRVASKISSKSDSRSNVQSFVPAEEGRSNWELGPGWKQERPSRPDPNGYWEHGQLFPNDGIEDMPSYSRGVGRSEIDFYEDSVSSGVTSPTQQLSNLSPRHTVSAIEPQSSPRYPYPLTLPIADHFEQSRFQSGPNLQQQNSSYQGGASRSGVQHRRSERSYTFTNSLNPQFQQSNLSRGNGPIDPRSQNQYLDTFIPSSNDFSNDFYLGPCAPVVTTGSYQVNNSVGSEHPSELDGYGYTTSAFSDLSLGGLDELEFIVITKPQNWFKPGRIFMTTWAESSKPSNETQTFVVMREGSGSCVCCLLKPHSLNDRRSGYDGQNCAIIFAFGETPMPILGEPDMDQYPVRIEKPTVKIDPTLRLNFSSVNTVPHSAKVRNVGRIDRDYINALKSAFLRAMGAKQPAIENTQEEFGQEYYSIPAGNKWTDPTRLPNEENLKITTSQTGTLHAEFKVQPAKCFQFGGVFKILWTEPTGRRNEGGYETSYEDSMVTSKYGEVAYTSIRRFVIVKKREGHCLCLPILTYGRRGTTKPGLKPQSHAIIYTELKNSKNPKVREIPGEVKLLRRPIKVQPRTSRDQLDPTSRLNYEKIYTVEYNVKVHFIGEIHAESIKHFSRDFNKHYQPLPETVDYTYDYEEA